MIDIIDKLIVMCKRIKPYSYFSNLLVFCIKLVLFFKTGSYAFIIASLYNLALGLARKKIYFNKKNFFSVGFFLIMASLCFIAYSYWIIISHYIVYYNIYMAITIATITFYDIGRSIYGIVESKRYHSAFNNVLMLVNLAVALISLELTQSALLSFTQVGVDNSLYNGIIGIFVGIMALIIGVIICFKSKIDY